MIRGPYIGTMNRTDRGGERERGRGRFEKDCDKGLDEASWKGMWVSERQERAIPCERIRASVGFGKSFEAVWPFRGGERAFAGGPIRPDGGIPGTQRSGQEHNALYDSAAGAAELRAYPNFRQGHLGRLQEGDSLRRHHGGIAGVL